MDPEVIAQIEEQLRQMNELLAQQNAMMANQLGAMKMTGSKMGAAATGFNTNLQSGAQAATKYSEAQAKAAESSEKWDRAAKASQMTLTAFSAAVGSTSNILGSLGGALLSAEKGFSKYGGTVDAAAGAAQGLASALPIVGEALGAVVGVLGKALSKVVGDALKLTDAIVNLRDETVKTAGAMPTSSEGLLKLANDAKYFGENIQVLGKITQGLGTNLVGLGDTAGRGATKFMELANVSEETRRRFGMMGVSQERLTELQGEYAKAQVSSGLAYTMQNKTMDQLRKESLKYAENMMNLSSLTGKQAEALQAEQDQARAVMQEKVAQRQDLIELQRLRQEGRTEEAAAFESKMKEKAEFRDRLVGLVGPEQASQVMRVIRTGVYDNVSGPLAALGVDFQSVGNALNNGAKGIDAANSLADNLSSAYDNTFNNLGPAALFLDDELKNIGVNAETLGRQNVLFGKTVEEREKILEADKNKLSKGSPMDAAIEKARATERALQQKYQEFLIDGIKKAAALLNATDLNKLAADAMRYGLIALKVALGGAAVATGILAAAKWKEWRASVAAKEAQKDFTKALRESAAAMKQQTSASRAATSADRSEAAGSNRARAADIAEARASGSATSADKAEATASRRAASADMREASASQRAAAADMREASASMKAAAADLREARASDAAAKADMREAMSGGGGLGGFGGGKGGKGGKLLRFAKGAAGGLAGLLGGLALDYGSEKATEAGHLKTGAALDVGSSAVTGAGLGGMIGSVVPILGTGIGAAIGGALGGLYGIYQNSDTIFGTGDAGSAPMVAGGLEEANKAAIEEQLAILGSISSPGGASTLPIDPNQMGQIAPLPTDIEGTAGVGRFARTGVYDAATAAAAGLALPGVDEELMEDAEIAAQERHRKELGLVEEQQQSVNSLVNTNTNFSNSLENTAKAMRIFRDLITSLNTVLGGVDENGNPAAMSPGGNIGVAGPGMQFGGDTDKILATIKQMESGNNYQAQNPTSSASGAYQFIDSTWQSLTKKAGIGTEFKSAKDAPAAIQDQIAQMYLQDIMGKAGGDLSKIPTAWFTGNVNGKSSAVSPAQVQAYVQKWMGIYGGMPGGTNMAGGMMPGMMGSQGGLIGLFQQMGGAMGNMGMMGGMGNMGMMGGGQAAALGLASRYLGMNETTDRQAIAAFLKAGGMGIDPKLEAWCAAFVNSALQQSGIRGSGSAVANSFQNWGAGVPVNQAMPGDVVLETKGKPPGATGGHVGLATGKFSGGKIGMLSGNSSNKVTDKMIPADSDVMVRRGLPMAERGGIFKGPDSGYLAMLHGKEAVVPLDNKFTRSQSSEQYTVNGKQVGKKEYDSFMKSHPELQNIQDKVKSMLSTVQGNKADPARLMQAASALMDTNLTGIKDEIVDKNKKIQSSLAQMVTSETTKAIKAVNEANGPMQTMANEMSRSMSKVMEAHTQSMNELAYKLTDMIDALTVSNDTTKKILKKASA